MRLPFIAIAVALTACGTEAPPHEDIVSGPNVATTMCPAGCTAGVETAIVTSKWIQLDEGIYEFAGQLDPTASAPVTGDGTHGSLDPVFDPCGGVAHSGACSDACNGAPNGVAGGGSCVAIACPTAVVIARCDL